VRRKRCRWKSAEQLSNSSPFEYGFLNDGEENALCPLCDLLCGEDTTPSRAIATAATSNALNFCKAEEKVPPKQSRSKSTELVVLSLNRS